MRKLRTLFVKDERHLATDRLNVDWGTKKWVAHRKYDGTSCAVIGGKLYKRYDHKAHFQNRKKEKKIPEGAIECCDPDPITKHWPHWVPVTEHDKWHLDAKAPTEDGTYELCGPKICTREDFDEHVYVNHNSEEIDIESLDYNYLKSFLETNHMEGLVIKHGNDWAKVRKGDFGFEW